ncbi:rhamnulokinase [Agilicoccus flavus]|uniref:rhamnulokinase n=1 Tax=Agilicoccus flavus TaxID=2775968 RepID=UPI001CF620F4|nr:rhamnulokinase family protein [Agilicoccus flavus]
MERVYAAVDLGASSGRVIAGVLDGDRIDLVETARFDNGPVEVPTGVGPRLHWDVLGLWREIVRGLRAAAHDVGPLDGVGIDTWGVDYGLLDARGALSANPASYRCGRLDGVRERVLAVLDPVETYATSGVQYHAFNTMFQLVADDPRTLAGAESALLMPDLLGHWLSGRRVAEVTNASTTGLLDARSRRWSPRLCEALEREFGVPAARLLPELVEPGTVLGPVRGQVGGLQTPGGEPTPLVAVASHDTASAVLAVPARHDRFAYVSCGTWSLVGLELDEPVLTRASYEGNFSNELGVDGTVRYLRNVMGLWVLNESLRTWEEQRLGLDLPGLLGQAAQEAPRRTLVDLDGEQFLAPGDMPDRIAEAARASGQPVPTTPAQVTRTILDSLALAYRLAIAQACSLAGREVDVVHMVGGGVRNELLCRLTADATGLPVVAGPEEGTAMGNVLVQARATGAITGDRNALRRIVDASTKTRRYEPDPEAADAWADAERRFRDRFRS